MTKILLRIIAGLEVLGGSFGTGFVIWQMSTITINIYIIVFGTVILGVYILSAIAGVALWLEKPFGRRASIVVQAIQVPKVFTTPLIFSFSFGFDAYISWVKYSGLSNLRIDFQLGANHELLINVPVALFGFGISIPACIFLIHLITSEAQHSRSTSR